MSSCALTIVFNFFVDLIHFQADTQKLSCTNCKTVLCFKAKLTVNYDWKFWRNKREIHQEVKCDHPSDRSLKNNFVVSEQMNGPPGTDLTLGQISNFHSRLHYQQAVNFISDFERKLFKIVKSCLLLLRIV